MMNEEKNKSEEKFEVQNSKSEEVNAATSQDEPIQPSTSNIQHNKEMEVHKHPHHVTHKKKWGEYFLEFILLFLAVFLGFVAENIREDAVEKHKEKQYM